MRLRNLLINSLLLLTSVLWNISCTVLQGNGTKPIVNVDGSPVSTEEFLYVYQKNNLNETPNSRKDINEYLDLFINFKLKVREAEAMRLHEDSAFINELAGYKKQLASPYLTETRLLDSLAEVTYERLKTEINASHILVLTAADASPEDTLKAYQKIVQLRDRIISGNEDFAQVAQAFSEDPSAKQNRGNLGYFTAMQMVYPFEEAAYSLAIDSISRPIRTSFGYHLIQVHDKRASQGRIQVSHILVRAPNGMTENDSTLAANRAAEIYTKAKNHEDWDLLCRQFSEDLGTKMKGGTLPWFKTGDISNIPTFEKAAFELQGIGDIHEPVKTAYGWHIIRLDGRQGLESFETLESKIRSSLTSDSRADLNQQELVKRLKKENHFKEKKEVVSQAMEFANETLNKGTWKAQQHWLVQQQELFRIEKTSYMVADFYSYLEDKQPLKYQANPKEMMRQAYQDYVKESLISYEEAHLGDKYYEYKMLSKEYRDGILLFQLMEDKIWNQAIKDSVGLKKYFEENRDKYMWDTRVSARIFNTIDEDALNTAKKFVENDHFSINKYDFWGASADFNKAQEKIINNLAQMLLQNGQRNLEMEFDNNDQNLQTYQALVKKLQEQNVDTVRIQVKPSDSGNQEFIVNLISSSVEDLEENMNQQNPLTINIESGLYQKGANQAVDAVEWKRGVQTTEIDNRQVLVEIREVIPAGRQELDEIKGQVISDYQTQLESLWIEELRNKYQVDIDENALETVYKKYHL